MLLGKSDLLPEVVRVLELEGHAILSCASRLKEPRHAEALQRALLFFQDALDQGGKIVVTGVGKSGKIGQKIAATLCSTGSLAVFLHPTEGLHGDLGLVRPQDVILALSYTGNTDEVVRLIPAFQALNVRVVGLGGNADSQLAAACHVWIDASIQQEACPYNLAPTVSTTLSLALGDAIAITLMQMRGFHEGAFAQNHPGGSLGKKFHLKVKDLMHHGDAVAVVERHTSMDEVIVLSTQKKLGAVLVTEGQKLIGLITDGDIRRALKHRQKFFDLQAEAVMTREPVTVYPDMKAHQALQLMEERPSQIAVLPVIDSLGNGLGLVRLHDLIRSF
jgi:arabinose-5-phosphate isomerase